VRFREYDGERDSERRCRKGTTSKTAAVADGGSFASPRATSLLLESWCRITSRVATSILPLAPAPVFAAIYNTIFFKLTPISEMHISHLHILSGQKGNYLN